MNAVFPLLVDKPEIPMHSVKLVQQFLAMSIRPLVLADSTPARAVVTL